MTDGLEALRRRGPLEHWEIRSLKIWYRAHYLWTSRRFQVTRSYSVPRWEERIIFPVIIKQAQDEFQKDLHRLAYIIDRLEEGDTVEDQLLGAWDDYADHLELSMKLFTDIGMMLVYSYFSFEEHTAILAESELMMKTIQHTHAIGSVIGFCGVETFRDTILQREASHVGVSWEGFYKEVSSDYVDFLESVSACCVHFSTILYQWYIAVDLDTYICLHKMNFFRFMHLPILYSALGRLPRKRRGAFGCNCDG